LNSKGIFQNFENSEMKIKAHSFSISKYNWELEVVLCAYFIGPSSHMPSPIQDFCTNVFSNWTSKEFQSSEIISEEVGVLCSLTPTSTVFD
jgi:hypothetical protein